MDNDLVKQLTLERIEELRTNLREVWVLHDLGEPWKDWEILCNMAINSLTQSQK